MLWCRGEEKDTERHDEVFGIRIGKLGQWHKAKSSMKQWSKNGRCRTKGRSREGKGDGKHVGLENESDEDRGALHGGRGLV